VLAALTPIPGHAIFLLLVQLALLLIVARIGALVSRGFGLPAVVGELAAGIVLGPSVFGHFAPWASALIFPQDSAQFNLLEVVGTLGMTLLLLLTGLETDLRLLKNLGRAAFVASATGMLVPFAMGYGLGMVMPAEYLAQPDRRLLFAAFLATAMAISAMPVIAKILMDLDLTKRNIGLVILSAGVVDDTAGWLVLSLIAGAAAQGGSVQIGGLAMTLVWLALFLAAMAFVVFPLLKLLLRVVAMRVRAMDTDLVIIVAATFLCAAATEHIGVHAVFGAFICGTLLRQVPHLNQATVHRLESFVFSILAPIFFGIVGLKVNLWELGGGTMLAVVLGIACLGKLLGCTIGSLWGGLSFWESLSIAVAMNARGAMELVVATIGLSLGILNSQMFSIIVVVAIVTSFMAPLGLRLTMRRVRMTDEEARRLLLEASKGVFDPKRMRIMIPTAAGPNALEAARIGFQLARHSDSPPEIVFVEASVPWWQRVRRMFDASVAGRGLEQHLDQIRALAAGNAAPRIRKVTGTGVSQAIIEEAQNRVDVIMIGASGYGSTVGGSVLEEVVIGAPCHVAIVKAGSSAGKEHRRVMVPIDGSTVARVAAEFALHYADAVGAELTLALISERRPDQPSTSVDPHETLLSPSRVTQPMRITAGMLDRPSLRDDTGTWPVPRSRPGFDVPLLEPESPDDASEEDELARISPVFRTSTLKPKVLRLRYDPSHSALVDEIRRGGFDFVVLGAENRAIQNKLFFGYEAQRIISRTSVSLVILVPHLGRLR
jgi:Kef-type K+ transport system membrane component KefB/nucleotide-binding universal stress UspA family protein